MGERTYQLDQKLAPLAAALLDYRKRRIVSFDVPGHKQGRANAELTNFLGKDCLSVDVNSMQMLDNLIHPVGVIKEAEELAADAFGAAASFFIVNGTSAAVQAMILSSLNPGEKIIMPRNVHRSAINALILARAVPVYINPGLDLELGIPLGAAVGDVEKAILRHPDAKAVLLNNPTYYGVCPDLNKIAKVVHAAGMRLLVDEAHGTHFYFSDQLPVAAMDAGADMSAVSLHKTGGSLTQSSILLLGKNVTDVGYVRQIINLTQTTSASYLLMSSLDLSRKNLALRGHDVFPRVIEYADYARTEINAIDGFYAFSRERINGGSFFDFDETKLSVHTRSMGLSGIEVYDILRDEYQIQVEFGDLSNFLAVLSIGDRAVAIERLIAALSEISRLYKRDSSGLLTNEYIEPEVVMTPAEAFYVQAEQLPIEETLGRIAGEFVMCYPPGIPVLAPGERVTADALDYIRYAKEKGSRMTGTEDLDVERLWVAL
jgi:arginine decarboxylase